MNRPRVSIASLMALIALVGVAVAALRSANAWWASGLFSLTLLGFGLAATYALFRRGPRRAFWGSFVAFGAGYLVLAFGPWCDTAIRPRLVTTKLFDALLPLAHPGVFAGIVTVFDSSADGGVRSFGFTSDGRPLQGMPVSAPTRNGFHDIGHCLAAWLLALLGGVTSRRFWERRDERRREAGL